MVFGDSIVKSLWGRCKRRKLLVLMVFYVRGVCVLCECMIGFDFMIQLISLIY
ncbi:hypothetical protein F9C07_2283860 [Aspergillus flavus]|uniref:Uncharacterized protein n=1 Tax=Aspergillus flavus (strain ATCC 200026 / FGSC A1120 / IAM 13836 / NRRL 3357 / JCM 12722 / SRRC 167) TaxID=332952 RepID=A0A7U2MVN7_ASPFN|nr:hypothetical protein F9C07_2283860 [Aspergillus flavus]